ncbi:DNA-binding protein RFX2-like isoform X2 [Paramacrobiotus metropolitanus]|uniref:DNA-binding protein RFX2-like isoform X2 n=1 Tax=Paramacrobiotus metropolitanus TaxID=2943436 RepID=UPI002445D373|nr:DNA-binding protein RFX2-like isoform X2 [Paramacrobiotus metropolitanus]
MVEIEVETGSVSDRDGDGAEVFGQDAGGNVRANPLTIQWLVEHFELAEGVSLPRSTIFTHYMRHCQEKSIEAMNPATFGKTIRSVFSGLKSRRLGTRGHSRYHYYGLRIKTQSPLAETSKPDDPTSVHSKPGVVKPSKLRSMVTPAMSGSVPRSHSPSFERQVSANSASTAAAAGSSSLQLNGDEFEHLGVPQRTVPTLLLNDTEWERVDALVTKASIYPITSNDLRMFRDLYRNHCEAIMDAVRSLKFIAVEALWASFWRSRYDEEAEKLLPFDKFYLVIGCNAVQDLIIAMDVEFFNTLAKVLIQDVLRPIPSSLTQVIRNFAKSMEGWVRESMSKMPRRLVHLKLLAASALAQTLRRYTSLNHLAQAARTVLTNPAQTGTMLADISRLDMNSIYEQGSLMCPCDFPAVKRYSDEFKALLSEYDACERWPTWIEKILDTVLGNCTKTTVTDVSQEFCQKWSYFSSLVIRDLTLRSAASFGSFHLIRLLFDEYVVYAVEQRTARFYNISSLQLFFNHLARLHPFSDAEVMLPGRVSVHPAFARLADSSSATGQPSSSRSPRRYADDSGSSVGMPLKRFHST